jgi:hypothetical protein
MAKVEITTGTSSDSDLEDALNRAVNMSSILVTLLEKALNVYEHYGDKAYHEERRKDPSPYGTYLIHKQDEETLLWSVYETQAQIRDARDQYCGLRMTMRPRKQ